LKRATAAGFAASHLGIERLYVRPEALKPQWTIKQLECSIARVYAAVFKANPNLDCVVLIPNSPDGTHPAFAAVAGAPELDSYLGSIENAASLSATRLSNRLGAVTAFPENLWGPRDGGNTLYEKEEEAASEGSPSDNEQPGDVVAPYSQQAVCVGGTFDRLHNGHKILLTVAAAVVAPSSNNNVAMEGYDAKLAVGVSDQALLKRKALSDLIEPPTLRAAKVLAFLRAVRPGLGSGSGSSGGTGSSGGSQGGGGDTGSGGNSGGSGSGGSSGDAISDGMSKGQGGGGGVHLELAMLQDPAGPAATDAALTCIVASKETAQGCAACNAKRLSQGLKPMRVVLTECFAPNGGVVVIDGGGASSRSGAAASSAGAGEKQSSSALRQSLVARPSNDHAGSIDGGGGVSSGGWGDTKGGISSSPSSSEASSSSEAAASSSASSMGFSPPPLTPSPPFTGKRLGREWCRRTDPCGDLPYVVGITGGIATGKSSVAARVGVLGEKLVQSLHDGTATISSHNAGSSDSSSSSSSSSSSASTAVEEFSGGGGGGSSSDSSSFPSSSSLPSLHAAPPTSAVPAVPVLDADKYGHLAYAPGTACCEALVAEFGEGIRDLATGGIHRPSLGSLVFDLEKGPDRLQALNAIVWPEILRLILADLVALKKQRRAEKEGGGEESARRMVVVVEAAIMVEAGWHDTLCDETWCVLADRDVQLQRLLKRNPGLGEAAAAARLAAAPLASGRVHHCHVLIDNSKDLVVAPNNSSSSCSSRNSSRNSSSSSSSNNSSSSSSSANSSKNTVPPPPALQQSAVHGGALDSVLTPLLETALKRAGDEALSLRAALPSLCPLACRWRDLCRAILLSPTSLTAASSSSIHNATTTAGAAEAAAVADGDTVSSILMKHDLLEAQTVDALASHWWRRIRDRYASPVRRYHGLDHLAAMFTYLDAALGVLNHNVTTATTTVVAEPHAISLAVFFHDAIYDPLAVGGTNERASAAFFKEFVEEAAEAIASTITLTTTTPMTTTPKTTATATTTAAAAAEISMHSSPWLFSSSSSSSSSSAGGGGSGAGAGKEKDKGRGGGVAAVVSMIERNANHLGSPGTAAEDSTAKSSGHSGRSAVVVGDEALFLDLDLSVLGAPPSAYARDAEQVRFEYHAYDDAAFRNGRLKVLKTFLEAPSLFFTPLFKDSLELPARRNLADETARLEAQLCERVS
jgi:dephospho-CoA kinase